MAGLLIPSPAAAVAAHVALADPHTQYFLLAGRSGGQTGIGGTGTTDALTLQGTSGVGAANRAIIWKVGTNGSIEAGSIWNSGAVGFGTGATAPTGDLHVVNTATIRGIVSSIHIDAVNAAGFHLYKSRGTLGSPTTVANADFIGQITFRPFGTVYNNRASIQAQVNGTVSGDTIPTDLIFNTSGGEAMRLGSGGIMTLKGPATLKGYTVATLPAGVQGHTAFVTDALAPTFGASIVGGGAVVSVVFYNGTNWIAF